eukprot:1174223-Prorocentrum_minimum.AAC.1
MHDDDVATACRAGPRTPARSAPSACTSSTRRRRQEDIRRDHSRQHGPRDAPPSARACWVPPGRADGSLPGATWPSGGGRVSGGPPALSLDCLDCLDERQPPWWTPDDGL